MWNRSALVEVSCGYHSQPLCSELLWFIQFSSSESTAKFIGIPSNLFPNVNISIQHKQSDVGLHDAESVGFNSPEILWKEVEVVMSVSEYRPYKSFSAQPIIGLSDCSLLAADITDLTFKCDSIFQRLSIYGNVLVSMKLGLLWHHACSQGGLSRLLHKIQISGGNYPQQNLQHEVVSHGVFREAWEVILLMVQKSGDHHLGMYKTL